MLDHLVHASAWQEQNRIFIYDALLASRLTVGSLTLGTLLLLFHFVRQLGRYDREVSARQAALQDKGARLAREVRRRTVHLADLATHLQTVREGERARLVRELHDDFGALLKAGKLHITRARTRAHAPGELLASLDRISQHLSRGIALKRRTIEDLRPSALSVPGLTAALEILSGEMSPSLAIPMQLNVTEFELSPQAQLAGYRFVRDVLTNIGKYAATSRVEVTLAEVGGYATVVVHDDGVGVEPQESYAGHHGLSGMKFGAESLGGAMHVASSPGQGTTVEIVFPQGPE